MYQDSETFVSGRSTVRSTFLFGELTITAHHPFEIKSFASASPMPEVAPVMIAPLLNMSILEARGRLISSGGRTRTPKDFNREKNSRTDIGLWKPSIEIVQPGWWVFLQVVELIDFDLLRQGLKSSTLWPS
jgi:hypothetical protein